MFMLICIVHNYLISNVFHCLSLASLTIIYFPIPTYTRTYLCLERRDIPDVKEAHPLILKISLLNYVDVVIFYLGKI